MDKAAFPQMSNNTVKFATSEIQEIGRLVDFKLKTQDKLNKLRANASAIDHVNIVFVFHKTKDLLDTGVGGSNISNAIVDCLTTFYEAELSEIKGQLKLLGVEITE